MLVFTGSKAGFMNKGSVDSYKPFGSHTLCSAEESYLQIRKCTAAAKNSLQVTEQTINSEMVA